MSYDDNFILTEIEKAKIQIKRNELSSARQRLVKLLEIEKISPLNYLGIILKLLHIEDMDDNHQTILSYCDKSLLYIENNRKTLFRVDGIVITIAQILYHKATSSLIIKNYQDAIDSFYLIIELYKNNQKKQKYYTLSLHIKDLVICKQVMLNL